VEFTPSGRARRSRGEVRDRQPVGYRAIQYQGQERRVTRARLEQQQQQANRRRRARAPTPYAIANAPQRPETRDHRTTEPQTTHRPASGLRPQAQAPPASAFPRSTKHKVRNSRPQQQQQQQRRRQQRAVPRARARSTAVCLPRPRPYTLLTPYALDASGEWRVPTAVRRYDVHGA
jgi:hypothetical protein